MPRKKMLTVHAHPDDECSRGGATVAHYAAEGVEATLVTCTDGAAGKILNPAFPPLPENVPIARTRSSELAESARELGYRTVHPLGFADSGTDGTAGGEDAFCHLPADVPAQRVADLIEAEEPQVVVGYGTNHARDPHPDHIRANRVLTRAVELVAERGRRPVPLVYHCAFSRRRHEALHRACLDLGLDSPYASGLDHPPEHFDDGRITTAVPLSLAAVRRRLRALRLHRSQAAEDSGWFTLPAEALFEYFPFDEYIQVGAEPAPPLSHDLFPEIIEGNS